MADGHAFTHDPQRCLNCCSCEVACKQWKGIAPNTFKLRWVYETTSGTFPLVTRTFHSVACQHCPEPPCVAACAPGAMSKRSADGVVVVDSGKCDGCRACLEACPFDVPQFDQDNRLQLCDLCLDRLAQGGRPICSDVCPTGALTYTGPLG
jgi:anaerobic dimethyl sulfoxide reductase subunit B (iron-sulfur subunit)